MTAKTVRAKLGGGEAVFGVFTPGSSMAQAEILARAGFDFLILDAEHGTVGPEQVAALAMACEAHGCAPLVRVPSLDRRAIGKPLDFGAVGIVAPMINSRANGEALLTAALYPPHGSRGLAMTRNLGFGMGQGDVAARINAANEAVLTIAQIETREAIANLDEIMSLSRIDVIFVGPADLSSSLGIPLQFTHPDFLGAMMQVATKAREHGKHLGVLVNEPEQIKRLYPLGFRLFAGYLNMMLAKMARRFVVECGEAAGGTAE
ncbi:HpcH/HpaI aldolase family protein [Qipengyuania qiaonensis]|uniref:HpcH/HpaI aldolase/citrate lyase domain-containing protein n=1 Tax=Qipengyuania qiaonensis TaxID=2867240 RepID=A0ABS7J5W2_9SPHN|nr:aldolase/citrate lyase family protein [Qipengyuania qiaonensis]MBX7482720.1 hypothetical protein [Qipengyuania qiaonensis]